MDSKTLKIETTRVDCPELSLESEQAQLEQ